jgi:hypothetical protein
LPIDKRDGISSSVMTCPFRKATPLNSPGHSRHIVRDQRGPRSAVRTFSFVSLVFSDFFTVTGGCFRAVWTSGHHS